MDDISSEQIKNYWSLPDIEKHRLIATDNFNRMDAEYREECRKYLEKQKRKEDKREISN